MTGGSVTASRDGKLLIAEVQGVLWRVPREGGAATRLTDWELEATAPALSPDGGTVALCGYRDGTFHLWTVGADGSGLRYFDFQVPGQATWQPGPIFSDGQRIVYVVDCSGSMLTRHLEAQNRFERLKIELRRSIQGLAEDRKFFVIFFNETSIPMPAPKEMQPAGESVKRKFLSWVDAQQADGGTDPADALRFALRLQPDTIFLLSDGSFSPKTAKLLRVLNRGKVTIHTIGFSDQANAALLGDDPALFG